MAWPNLRSPRPSSYVLTTMALRPAKRPLSSTTTLPFLTLRHQHVISLLSRSTEPPSASPGTGSPSSRALKPTRGGPERRRRSYTADLHAHDEDSWEFWCSSVLCAADAGAEVTARCQSQPRAWLSRLPTRLRGSGPVREATCTLKRGRNIVTYQASIRKTLSGFLICSEQHISCDVVEGVYLYYLPCCGRTKLSLCCRCCSSKLTGWN